MYYLIDRKTRKPAKMRDGSWFTYTTEWTARLGAKYLGIKNKARYRVVPMAV